MEGAPLPQRRVRYRSGRHPGSTPKEKVNENQMRSNCKISLPIFVKFISFKYIF